MKIIKYGSKYCGPCRASSTVLQELKVPFEDVDVDENEDIIALKNIRSIPLIEFYKEGEETPVYTHRGLLTKVELQKILDTYGRA